MSLSSLGLIVGLMIAGSTPDKITFNLSDISPQGLIGSAGNYRSLDYEFCIPGDESHSTEVQSIDPTIRIYPRGRGRIGCGKSQYLCVGNTHRSGWRSILMKLADLPYIEKIQETYWE